VQFNSRDAMNGWCGRLALLAITGPSLPGWLWVNPANCGHSQAEHYNRQDALCSTLDDRRNRPRAFSGLGRAGCLMG